VIGNNAARGRGRGPATVGGALIGGFAGSAIAGSGCRHHRRDQFRDRYDDRRYDDNYGPGY
jgi:uncharacterized protein YcfJ